MSQRAKVIKFNVLHACGADDVGVDIVDVDGIDVVVRTGDVDDGDGGEDDGPGLVGGVEDDAKQRHADDTGERGARISSGEY